MIQRALESFIRTTTIFAKIYSQSKADQPGWMMNKTLFYVSVMQWHQNANMQQRLIRMPRTSWKNMALIFFRLEHAQKWFKSFLLLQPEEVLSQQTEGTAQALEQQTLLLPNQTTHCRDNCCSRWELHSFSFQG